MNGPRNENDLLAAATQRLDGDLSNHGEALSLGLFLALTAPTDAKAQEVSAMCERLARRVSEEEIILAKEQALKSATELCGYPNLHPAILPWQEAPAKREASK